MDLNARFEEDFSLEIEKLLESEVQSDSYCDHSRTLLEQLRK